MSEADLISKLTSKSQTVVPRDVRKQLGLKPGDRIRYRMRGRNVTIEKVSLSPFEGDPFGAFDEWTSAADEKAYADL